MGLADINMMINNIIIMAIILAIIAGPLIFYFIVWPKICKTLNLCKKSGPGDPCSVNTDCDNAEWEKRATKPGYPKKIGDGKDAGGLLICCSPADGKSTGPDKICVYAGPGPGGPGDLFNKDLEYKADKNSIPYKVPDKHRNQGRIVSAVPYCKNDNDMAAEKPYTEKDGKPATECTSTDQCLGWGTGVAGRGINCCAKNGRDIALGKTGVCTFSKAPFQGGTYSCPSSDDNLMCRADNNLPDTKPCRKEGQQCVPLMPNQCVDGLACCVDNSDPVIIDTPGTPSWRWTADPKCQEAQKIEYAKIPEAARDQFKNIGFQSLGVAYICKESKLAKIYRTLTDIIADVGEAIDAGLATLLPKEGEKCNIAGSLHCAGEPGKKLQCCTPKGYPAGTNEGVCTKAETKNGFDYCPKDPKVTGTKIPDGESCTLNDQCKPGSICCNNKCTVGVKTLSGVLYCPNDPLAPPDLNQKCGILGCREKDGNIMDCCNSINPFEKKCYYKGKCGTPGAPCAEDIDCKDRNCKNGVCQAPQKYQTCGIFAGQCGSTMECCAGKCFDKGKCGNIDAPCGGDIDCDAGNYCAGTGNNKKCAARKSKEGSCSRDRQCKTGYMCCQSGSYKNTCRKGWIQTCSKGSDCCSGRCGLDKKCSI